MYVNAPAARRVMVRHIGERIGPRRDGQPESAVEQPVPQFHGCVLVVIAEHVHGVDLSQGEVDGQLPRAGAFEGRCITGMRIGHRAALLLRVRGERVIRGVVVRLGRTRKSGIERTHQVLQIEKAHVAIEAAIAHLLIPVDEIVAAAEPAGLALEVALVVNERASGIGDHHVGVIQIFGQSLQPHVFRRDHLVIEGGVVGVNVSIGREPSRPRHILPSLQRQSDLGQLTRLQFHAAAG